MIGKVVAILAALALTTGALAQTPTNPSVVSGITGIPTYGAGVPAVALTGAGDLACVEGSATKVVRVLGFQISAIASTAIVVDLNLIMRSTLDTGGTPIVVTPVALDPANAVATAAFRAFSAAPTAGTTIGTLRTAKLAVGTAGQATGIIGDARFGFYGRYGQAVMLRDAVHAICINVSATGTGASYDIDAEWTEANQ
jgi:hypothetical protein